MGFLSRKKEVEKPVDESENILITTTNDIPGQTFKVIGLVIVDLTKVTNITNINISNPKKLLSIEVMKKGADAVIGFRYYHTVTYGTAVKYI